MPSMQARGVIYLSRGKNYASLAQDTLQGQNAQLSESNEGTGGER